MKFSKYLEQIYNEIPFDIAKSTDLNAPEGKGVSKIFLYKGKAPTKEFSSQIGNKVMPIASIPLNSKTIEKINGIDYITHNGIQQLLEPFIKKGFITQKAIDNLKTHYKKGIPIFSDVVEINIINKDTIEITSEAKNKAVTGTTKI